MAVKRKGLIQIDTVVKGEASVKSATESFTKMSSGVSGVGAAMTKSLVASGLLMGGLRKLSGMMGGLIKTARDWQDWVGNNAKAIDGMSKAVDDIISPLQLMKTRTQLTTGEFALSEKQLQAVSKAAIIHTRINKGPMAGALQAIVKTIRMGSNRALAELGINIDLVGSKTERTAQAIKAITDNFGDVRIATENSNEVQDKLNAKLERTVGTLGNVILQSDAWQATSKAAVGVVESLTSAIDDYLETSENTGTIAERLEVLDKKRIKQLQSLIQQQKDFLGVETNLQHKLIMKRGGYPDDLKNWENELRFLKASLAVKRGHVAAEEELTAARAGGGMSPSQLQKTLESDELRGGPSKKAKKGAKKGGKKRKDPEEERLKSIKALISGNNDAAKSTEMRIEASGKLLEGLVKEAEAQREINREVRKGIDAYSEHQLAWDVHIDKMKTAHGESRRFIGSQKVLAVSVESLSTEFTDMAMGGLQQFGSGMLAAIDAAVTGEATIGEAMRALTKNVLMSIAQQALVRGIFELAAGFSMLFTNPPEAGSHFIAAGIFFGAAAAAGAAGMAIGGGGGKKASGGASSRTAATNAQREKRKPKFGKREDKTQAITIRVVLGPQTDPAAAIQAQKQISAQVTRQNV